MAELVVDILSGALFIAGLVFFIGGTVGLIRVPDFYSRLHPSTKSDTLGACSFILALCLQSGLTFVTLKLLAVAFFLLLASATCGNAIGRSGFKTGLAPWHKDGVEPVSEKEA